MARNNEVVQNDFYCTKCGNKGIPIARALSKRQRENGHLKKIYCLKCKDSINHVEVKPHSNYTAEDFFNEFEAGRFLADGTRSAAKDLRSCGDSGCSANYSGKCWNANKTIQCERRLQNECR